VRTYSPSLDDFDSDDPSLEPVHQQFEIPYAASGLTPRTKTLSTDELSVDILTTEQIAAYDDVASGTPLTATWAVEPGEHGWYVRTADPYGAVDHSVVHTFTAVPDPTDPPTDPTTPTPDPTTTPTTTPTPAPGSVVAGTPTLRGKPRVGRELRVDPGTWSPGATLTYAWYADGQRLAGEAGPELALRARHRGARISVAVTGAAQGLAPTTAAVEDDADVRRGRLAGPRPRVLGRPAVGAVLRVRPGNWTAGAKLRFVWLADGRKVGTGKRIVLRATHRGDRISVRVVARKPGYETLRRTSPPTRGVGPR
jgi:hypothetical protein